MALITFICKGKAEPVSVFKVLGKRTGLRDEQAGDRYNEKITGRNRLVVLVMVLLLAVPLARVTSAGEEKPTVLVTDKHRQLVYRYLPALIKCGVGF